MRINTSTLSFLNPNKTYRVCIKYWKFNASKRQICLHKLRGIIKLYQGGEFIKFKTPIWIFCHNSPFLNGGWDDFLIKYRLPYKYGWALKFEDKDNEPAIQEFHVFFDNIIY